MPEWAAHNPAHFWNAADQYERANGAVYREVEIALPRELTPEQNRELVADFIRQELGDRHAYQWAIHTPKAAFEKGDQPHAHIMYSERTIDGIARDPDQYFKRANKKNPERGGCVKDSAGTEERLQATRERWADVQNAHLERHGHTARVTHLSLKDQGIDREPERHIGPKGIQRLKQEDISALLERRAAEGQLERSQQAVGVIDLSGNIAKAKAERVELAQTVDTGKADIRAMFAQHKQAEQARKEAEQRKAMEAERAKAREVERQKIDAERQTLRELQQQRREQEQERQKVVDGLKERRGRDGPGMSR
ncbi:MAG TPA: MobA/MobL family protein [Candidimonas sp.]|nr:MobA/MobL family protein [Candidimonas sp.]